MKSFLAVAILAALSGAQDAKPKSSAPAASDPTSLAATCVKACKSNDNVCKAECTKVPSPSEESIGLHNQCIEECNMLSSGPEATACQVGCVQKNFMDYTRPAPVEEEPTANSTDGKNSTTSNSTSKDGSTNSTKSNSTSSSSHAPLTYTFPAYAYAIAGAGLASFYLI